LHNDLSIRLYPSLGLLEGTKISMGRGTQQAFQIYGSPKSKGDYTFKPISIQGMAKNPPYENQQCMGVSLIIENATPDSLQAYRFTLKYILDAFNNYTPREEFFIENNFFENLEKKAKDISMQNGLVFMMDEFYKITTGKYPNKNNI
jgi:hypothetical protein